MPLLNIQSAIFLRISDFILWNWCHLDLRVMMNGAKFNTWKPI